MNNHLHTTRFTRGKLPHWEVEGGRYFVTVRCADSLPREAIERLRDIHTTLTSTEARSEEYCELQRYYFRTLEKYLDAGTGARPLRSPSAAEILGVEFRGVSNWQVDVPHFCVMPNHWHAMVEPRECCTKSLAEIMQRLKGRSARTINGALGQTGPLWQREWFDRWMRNDAEYDCCVQYSRNNPTKAGLPTQDRWTQ